MGGDGGSIPSRYDLVELQKTKKPDEYDHSEQQFVKWCVFMMYSADMCYRNTCALTKEPLHAPIVACDLGYLFNKASVLQKLLDKTMHKTKFHHIRSLKVIHTLLR